MALKIRLRQQGRRNRLVYRLVLTDSRSPRDGKYLETLGWYNPHEAADEKNMSLQADRLEHWLSHGAVLSENAENLVKRGAPEILVAFKKKLMEARQKVCHKKRIKRKKRETAGAA